MYTVLESIVSHSLGRRMSASEHSYHSGRSKGELYLRGQVLQRGVGERFSIEPRDKIPLVSLLLSCTYFKHYFRLSLNVKCFLLSLIECSSLSTSLLECLCFTLYHLLALAYQDHLIELS